MRPVDPRLVRLSGATRRFLTLSVLVGLGVATLVIGQAWLVADALAGAHLDGAGLAELRTPLLLLLGAVLARGLLAAVQEEAAQRAASRVKAALRAAVLRRVVDAPEHAAATSAAGRSTGSTAALVTRGVDALDGYFARFLPQLVLAGIVPVAVLTQIALVDWVSGLLIAVTLPLVPLFMILVGLHTRRATERQWRSLSLLAGHFLDVVAGLPTLKVFGRARAQADTIRRVSDEHRSATMRLLQVAFLSALVLELVATLSVALVAVGVGLRLLGGTLDLRTALVVLILAPEAYLPLRNVGASFHASTEGLAAAAEAFELLEAPGAPEQRRWSTVPDLPRQPVRLDGVTVTYAGTGGDALRAARFTLTPGEVVALTGRSGAGKTTALAVLLGLRTPDAGRVLVGDTDLADLEPAAWRDRVAWLPQRPLLFAGSVADNVRFGEPDATDEEVDAALAAVAAGFVSRLPAGASTSLGEGGAGLSAGQRQRVALARFVLRVRRRDSGLLLLDEPTAHLDGATEERVVAALLAACTGRTTLLATHRPAVAAAADRVVGLAATRTGDVAGAA